jgi:sulfate adenylyltransferase/3'-phosphoadenosine 5'-phosphosulfate synthase
VLWFTGLSGAGKSTLTAMVAAELRQRGVHVEALDGDEIRKNLSKGLGFSKEDRDANVRRLGFVANLIARSGGCAITAAISPYRAVREEVRRSAERFCEVYCDCPVAVLAERDPKGLYEKALRGEIKNFTGVDDPYEAPEAPEIHLHTDRESPEASAARVIARLEQLGLIEAQPHAHGELAEAHGGELVEQLLSEPTARAERERASSLPKVLLDADAKSWLWGFATGAFSPLSGFVGEKDYLRISAAGRLERGLAWPAPPLLPLPDDALRSLPDGCVEVALIDADQRPLATLRVSEVWTPRRSVGRHQHYLAGDVSVFDLADFDAHAQTARAVRATFEQRGQFRVAALVSEREPSLATEYAVRAALEWADGVLLLPLGDAVASFDLEARVRDYSTLAEQPLMAGRVSVCPLPWLPSGPEAQQKSLLEIIAQNFGASRLLRETRPARGSSL